MWRQVDHDTPSEEEPWYDQAPVRMGDAAVYPEFLHMFDSKAVFRDVSACTPGCYAILVPAHLHFSRCASERERSERERCASSRVPLAISRFFVIFSLFFAIFAFFREFS